MGDWQKTGCVLCAQNCGLEVLVENNRITRVRPDRENPRSRGYVCRKGLNVIYHQYPKDRLTEPLKRVGDSGSSPSVGVRPWEKFRTRSPRWSTPAGRGAWLTWAAAPRSGNFEAAFGLSLIRELGSQYYYSSAGQEFSGSWWVFGRMLGKAVQYRHSP